MIQTSEVNIFASLLGKLTLPKSPISTSNSYASNPEKQSKRKHLYNISSTTMSNTNKKKKQKK